VIGTDTNKGCNLAFALRRVFKSDYRYYSTTKELQANRNQKLTVFYLALEKKLEVGSNYD
jgi:hypothetical protein